jgi:hypothetical protein
MSIKRMSIKSWASSTAAGLKIVFSSKRGLKKYVGSVLICFGLISAVLQFLSAVFGDGLKFNQPLKVIALTTVVSLIYGIARALPKTRISHCYKDIDVTLNVVIGDILADGGQIVVGFSDTFDTDIADGVIISPTSLQGKLLATKFNDDRQNLDSQLAASLASNRDFTSERRNNKAKGKLKRYPIGTVATLTAPDDSSKIYGLAYSKMGNDLVAESSVHYLWDSLGQLWEAVYTNGQRKPISIPLLGTELARINALDRESILRMILLSFMARSREKLVCKELTLYIYPPDRDYINMLELEAFIKHI